MQAVVDPFGRAAFEISDDEADIEAERRGFDTRDGAPLAGPRTGSVSDLGITAHDVLVFQSAFDANLVGLVINIFSTEAPCRAGRTHSRRRSSRTMSSPQAERNVHRPGR